jgi:uncharacterized iron-regulated membrane protein
MRDQQKKANWAKIRKLFNDIHLWIGLASGLIIFVICLSGTIYTYNTEIRELASPHLHRVEAKTQKKSVDELIRTIQQNHSGAITSISIPNSPTRSYAINLKPPTDKSRFGVTYYVNPYSGELLGTSLEKTKTDEFMGYLFSLHRWLLLDKIEKPIFSSIENRKLGSYISGTATILFTLGLLTGIVIWFPRKIKNWRQGLTIKFSSNWKRINHDLHNSLSLYAFIFLLLMSITGPQWSFDWYRTGLRKALGTHQESTQQARGSQTSRGESSQRGQSKSQEDVQMQLLPIEEYLTSASSTLTYPGDYRISFPKTNDEPIRISKYKTGFFAPAAADQIMLNTQNATVENIELFKDKPFKERVSSSIKALHIGDVYGQFSKLIYFFACLIATSLPVTGTLIWINKMKKTKKQPTKKKVTVPY